MADKTQEDPIVIASFALDVTGQNKFHSDFTSASGLDSTFAVIDGPKTLQGGKAVTHKIPGTRSTSDIVLSRPMTGDMSWWDWRQKLIEGGVAEGRGDGSITVFGQDNAALTKWDFFRGWPSKYEVGALSASDNGVLLETITITHEGLVRAAA